MSEDSAITFPLQQTLGLWPLNTFINNIFPTTCYYPAQWDWNDDKTIIDQMWLKHLWLWILVRPSTSATLCVFCRGFRGTVHWTITICMTGMRGKTGESFCLFVNKKSWISQNSKVFLVTLVYHINCFFCIKDILYIPRNQIIFTVLNGGTLWQENKKRGTLLFREEPKGGRLPSTGEKGDIVTST